MMTRHGGTHGKAGFYWNPARWEITTLPKGGAALPGGPEERYLRVPGLLLLLLAPVMGGFYVIFLPFIGFAMVLGLAAQKVTGALRNGAVELLSTLSPAWQPGVAYFAGKRKPWKEEGVGGDTGEPMEGLRREIEEKRETDA